MTDTERTLILHFAHHPLMEPRDAVKLLYQNVFGGGHLIDDPAASLERLKAEYAETPQDLYTPLLEDIGNGYSRLNLAAMDRMRLSPEAVNDVFVLSANLGGRAEGFESKLSLVEIMAEEGRAPFSAEEFSAFRAEYEKAGCPMLSHSEKYRAAYRPAYRVVRTELVKKMR